MYRAFSFTFRHSLDLLHCQRGNSYGDVSGEENDDVQVVVTKRDSHGARFSVIIIIECLEGECMLHFKIEFTG